MGFEGPGSGWSHMTRIWSLILTLTLALTLTPAHGEDLLGDVVHVALRHLEGLVPGKKGVGWCGGSSPVSP